MTKMTTTKKRNRIFCVALALCMVLALAAGTGVTAFAQEDTAPQESACTHAHTDDDGACGFVEGTPCGHQHGEACGADGESCTHSCEDESCGFVPPAACAHQHSEACGGLAPPPEEGTLPAEGDGAPAPQAGATTVAIMPLAGGTWGGTGSQADPYTIEDQADLEKLATEVNSGNGGSGIEYVNKHFLLTADISLTGMWTPIGDATKRFRGSFDGQGKTISGLSVSGQDYSGLFGHINEGGVVKNLNVTGVLSFGGEYSGGIVGYAGGNIDGVKVEGCSFSGTILGGNNVGGIVGKLETGTVTDCFNAGSVTGTGEHVGGIEGFLGASGTVTNCFNTGAVTGNKNVGGVVGSNTGTVEACFNTGAVNSTGNNQSNNVGGIAGFNKSSSTVSNCYNTGAVAGQWSNYVGGLVGWNDATVSCSYNTGSVSSANGGGVGGLIGWNRGGTVSNCVSLSAEVSAPKDEEAARVAAVNTSPGVLQGNMARADMEVSDKNGAVATPSDDSGAHGADIAMDGTTTQASVFGASWAASVWAAGDANMAAGAKLPTLLGIAVTQQPSAPRVITADGSLYYGKGAGDKWSLWLDETLSLEYPADSTWTAGENTLALNGFSFTSTAASALKIKADVEITLTGKSVIDSASSNGEKTYGIYADGCSVTISGEGELVVVAGTSDGNGMRSTGIYAENLVVSAKLRASGTTGTNGAGSIGIHCANTMRILEGADIFATGDKADGASYGVMAEATISMSGGKLTGTSGTSGSRSAAIWAALPVEDVIVTGGAKAPENKTLIHGPYGYQDADNNLAAYAVMVPVVAPAITTTSVLDGRVGTPYSASVEATGTAPLAWRASSGMPDGLSLDSTTGKITGTPTKPGTFQFSVLVSNSVGSDQKTFTIKVAGAGSTAVITGVSASADTLVSKGGAATIAVAGSSLPAGITVTAFNSSGAATAITGSTDASGNVTLNFPANTSATENMVYTIKASLDGGATWAAQTCTVTVLKNAPVYADPAKDTIAVGGGVYGSGAQGDPFAVTAGTRFTLTLQGDRQDAPGNVAGDTKLVPESWSVNPSGTFPYGGPYVIDTQIDNPGNYTLTVVYRQYEWDGAAWGRTEVTDTKTATVRVDAKSGQVEEEEKDPPEKRKSSPQTGDAGNMGLWLALVIAAMVLLTAGAIAIAKNRTRQNKKEN